MTIQRSSLFSPAAAALVLLVLVNSTSASAQVFFGTFFSDSRVLVGDQTSIRYQVVNSVPGGPLSNITFTNALPVGLEVAADGVIDNECGGTLIAQPGTNSIDFTGGEAMFGSCQITVRLLTSATGTLTNTTSMLTTSGGNAPPSQDSIDVFAPVRWDNPGSGNFFDAANWDSSMLPMPDELTFISNGGTAVADGTITGNPTAFTTGGLTVGNQLGGGTLNINNVDLTVNQGNTDSPFNVGVVGQLSGISSEPTSGMLIAGNGTVSISDANILTTERQLNVAEVIVANVASGSATGQLTIERVNTVDIGADLDVGNASIYQPADTNGTSVAANGTLIIRDVDSLNIDACLDVADGNIDDFSSVFGVAVNTQTANVLIERVDTASIGEIDIGGVFAARNQTEIVMADVILRDIGSITVDSDLDFADSGATGAGAEAGSQTYRGTLTLERSNMTVTGDMDLNEFIDIGGEGRIDIEGTFNLVDSRFVNADNGGSNSTDIGRLTDIDGDPIIGGGAPGNSVRSFLNLTRSEYIAANEINVARRVNNVPGENIAVIDLDDGSRLETAMLELNPDADIVVHLDGINRVGPSTRGSINTYSAVDVTDAMIAGEIVVDFDFVPLPGISTFDIIVTGSSTALDDFTGTTTVVDLPAGMTVDSFGVVEENGVDILRLQISGTPLVDLTITKDDGQTTAIQDTQLTYTIVVGNNGPNQANNATMTDTVSPLLLNPSWTCTPSAGASCNAGPVNGNISDTPVIDPGATATYTLTGTINPDLIGLLDNTAMVEQVGDTDLNNNSATDTTQVFALPASLSGTMTVSGEFGLREVLTYTVVINNAGPGIQRDRPNSDEFFNVLPDALELISATSASGMTTADPATNTVTWNGEIPNGGSITILIEASVINSAGGVINNQGEIRFDTTGDGLNDTTVLTDDPNFNGDADATGFVFALPVPTLSQWGIWLLAVMMLLVSARVIRKQRKVA